MLTATRTLALEARNEVSWRQPRVVGREMKPVYLPNDRAFLRYIDGQPISESRG
jgi:hypothetical protein